MVVGKKVKEGKLRNGSEGKTERKKEKKEGYLV